MNSITNTGTKTVTPVIRFQEFAGLWNEVRLREVISRIYGGNSLNSVSDDDPTASNKRILKSSSLREGFFYPIESKAISRHNYEYATENVTADTLLVSRANTEDLVGESGYVTSDYPDLFIPDKLWVIRSDKRKADLRFLAHVVATRSFRSMIAANSNGSTAGMKNISQSAFLSLKVYLPSVPEQRKIAAFLSILETRMQLLECRVELLKKWKRGVLDKIFREADRRVRSNAVEDREWKSVKVKTLIKESRIKGNSGDTANKLTVKLWGKGVIEKKEIHQGSINTQYYRRYSGQFIYSKLDFLNCAFAIIPRHLDGFESTLDLPALDFTEQVDPLYFLERIRQKNFYQRLGEQADGSRKARRIQVDTFLNFEFPLPPPRNQGEASEILKSISTYQFKSQRAASQLKLWLNGVSTIMLRCE